MRYVYCLLFLVLTGCSSVPKYEEMPTVEDKLSEANGGHINDGMMITNRGAVLDIKVEEVQAEKKRLVAQNAELEQEIKSLKEQALDDSMKIRTLRMAIGLPVTEPKPGGHCCDSSGNMVGYKAAPTLSEEIEALRGGGSREPAVSQPTPVVISSPVTVSEPVSVSSIVKDE